MRKLLRKAVYLVCTIPAGIIILVAFIMREVALLTIDLMERLEGPAPCEACGCERCCEAEMCLPSSFPHKEQLY